VPQPKTLLTNVSITQEVILAAKDTASETITTAVHRVSPLEVGRRPQARDIHPRPSRQLIHS
jgi:hypothetical protein